MSARVRPIFVAELAALSGGASLVSTAGTHLLVAGLLGGIVRGEIGAFAFAAYAYTVAAGLVTLPLLGELGTWLRTPSAPEWTASLPCTALDRALARLAVLLVAVGGLSMGSLLPLSLLAPGLDLSGRLVFAACGLGATLSVASALLLLQALLERVAPALLVLLQTAMTVVVAGTLLLGLPLALRLTAYGRFGDLDGNLALAPPFWFAAPITPGGVDATALWMPALCTAIALVGAWLGLTLAGKSVARIAGGAPPIDRVLEPLRRAALALWVRREERATFDLVFAAMPHEREVALRTAPLLAVPLIFAWVALGKEPGADKDAFVALILFTPGFYLPVLLSHVPASASFAARWLLDSAPVAPAHLQRGAFKAVCVRYVIPLHIALGFLAWQQAGGALALRLALPAMLVSILVCRVLYTATVDQPPLSIPPEEAGDPQKLTGPLMAAGISLAIVAIVAEHFVTTPALGLVLSAALLGVLVLEEYVPVPRPDAS
ncbi:hypothetical protein [Engelhardtia mirabilis]|uniref:Uncharacterized protein n=1 Tax=Engelhardtia mirabilis TaxID=2528011 RepID=A0A518BSD1_9BACT|nr:hypothetical protein Pla133_50030 [Planctomycetes bacterium Pla133]QDV04206.1 hypothetical protein Pla86_50010 [Planctomycetes bacterium Pla86]